MARGRPEAENGPFLKWAGGKGALLPAYEALYPRRFGVYHEPFLGAGAVFFRLAESGRIERAELSDVNADLILAFAVVKTRTAELIAELTRLRARHDEAAYYAERERFNSTRLGDVARAARVIYLNKTGYNGLYRVNSRGEYNVPCGRYSNPRIFSEQGLWAASERLKKATIEARDFTTVERRAKAGDFVYFDPPYDPLNRTAYFTSYARGGFGRDAQEQLASTFRTLDRAGVQVMLSNHDTPLVRELYQDYDRRRLEVTRAINSKAEGRRTLVGEVVVRNYPS